MAAPSGPPVFSNQELVNELEGLLPTHWDEQQLERKWDACVANPAGGLERFAFTAMELKYLARERLAEVHALRVENNLLRGENASLAARCDAMQKLVQEAVPEAAARLEYERSSYRGAKFRDAGAAPSQAISLSAARSAIHALLSESRTRRAASSSTASTCSSRAATGRSGPTARPAM